jgi:ABC-type antimicrobial peptide transport system permease subunit
MVADTDRTMADAADRCTIFAPMAQRRSSRFLLVAASRTPAATMLKEFDASLASALPDAAMFDVTTADAYLTRTVIVLRSIAAATLGLGLLGLIIAVAGIYGVTAYTAGLRRSEFGIRKALGETNAGIYGLVVTGALRMVGIGLLVGLPAAYVMSVFLTRALLGVAPSDVSIYFGVSAILVFVTVAVTCQPAWQSSREEPAVTLRDL